MSEKSSSDELKCALAACVEPVKVGDKFDRLPLHATIVPPVFVPESKYYDLVSEYYNLISSWSSFMYDEGDVTAMFTSTETARFGTAEHPVPVRRVSLDTVQDMDDLLTLRGWLRESTEDVCGEESTVGWVLGELHISEGENDLSVLENRLAIDSLVLFVKRGAQWRAEEKFIWND